MREQRLFKKSAKVYESETRHISCSISLQQKRLIIVHRNAWAGGGGGGGGWH